jgi:hypothetical protein
VAIVRTVSREAVGHAFQLEVLLQDDRLTATSEEVVFASITRWHDAQPPPRRLQN